MNFEKVEITINSPLTSSAGIPLPAGIVGKVNVENQVISLNKDVYHAYIYFWANEQCYVDGKTKISIDGLHETIGLQPDDDAEVLGVASNELYLELPITGEDDIDTLQKCKDLIIAKLAESLGLQTTDFS